MSSFNTCVYEKIIVNFKLYEKHKHTHETRDEKPLEINLLWEYDVQVQRAWLPSRKLNWSLNPFLKLKDDSLLVYGILASLIVYLETSFKLGHRCSSVLGGWGYCHCF